jgi:hypothetical protein
MYSCNCNLSEKKKLWISVLTALIAIVLFSPVTFKLMRGIAGGWVATSEGLAKSGGLILHGVVFVLVLILFMKGKPASGIKQSTHDITGLDI